MEDRNGAYMKFAIDSITGLITTRSEFDRETQPVYYINVMAVDGTNSDAPGHFPVDTPNSGKIYCVVCVNLCQSLAPCHCGFQLGEEKECIP